MSVTEQSPLQKLVFALNIPGPIEEGALDPWIQNALKRLSQSERDELRVALQELLAANHTGPELQGIWEDCAPVWILNDEDLVKFLDLVEKSIR